MAHYRCLSLGRCNVWFQGKAPLYLVVWGLLAVACMTVGCGPQEDLSDATPGPRGPVDRSLLTGDPCEPMALQASWRSAGYTVGEFYLNSARVDDGLLTSIEIHLDYDATCQEVLERYGLPYKLWSGPAGTHIPFVLVELYYPESGLSVQVEVPRHAAELRLDSPVTEVWYFAPVARERFLDEAYDTGIPMPSGDLESLLWD